ncbi:MarR family transcriptional regulator [Nocardia heshunensis]
MVAALDRIARGVRAHRQAIASRTGLTPLQAELLRVLADGPPPEPLTGLLATELGVSQPTVSDSLLALERKGHVARQPAPGDRRRSTIVLTPAGTKLSAELAAGDAVLRDCVGALPATQQDQTLRTLLDLIAGLLDAGVVQVARTCTTCRYFRPAHTGVPHCELLGQPLPPADLRVNCPEHQPAD